MYGRINFEDDLYYLALIGQENCYCIYIILMFDKIYNIWNKKLKTKTYLIMFLIILLFAEIYNIWNNKLKTKTYIIMFILI